MENSILINNNKKSQEYTISVIVPVYNNAKYITACLDSILAQTYDNIEIIVVNDGSTDSTQQILDKFIEQYPRKIKGITISNSGVSKARRIGMQHAAGDWIGFVDSDDTVEPDMYERLIRNCLNYGADISHCGYKTLVFDNGNVHYFYNTKKLVVSNSNEGTCELLEGTFVQPSLCNKIYKRTLIQRLLDQKDMLWNTRFNEDLLMNFVMFSHADISVYEDFCGYNYYARKSSATRSGFNIRKVIDPVRVRKWILSHCDTAIKETAIKEYLKTCINAYTSLCVRKEYKKESEQLRSILMKHKKYYKLLGRNIRIKYLMIHTIPHIYPIIDYLYSKYFRVKRYE